MDTERAVTREATESGLENTLENKAYQVDQQTNEDGTVNVTIKKAKEENGAIVVTFETPLLKKKSEVMEFPNSADEKIQNCPSL